MEAEPGRRFLKQPAAKLEPVIVASWIQFDLSEFCFIAPDNPARLIYEKKPASIQFLIPRLIIRCAYGPENMVYVF